MDKLATGECRVGQWGAWQVATVASATLNCKTPRIYQQCQQQIDFKANGQTDRRTDTHTSSKLPLATFAPSLFPPSCTPQCHPTQCVATRPSLFAYFHRLFGICFFSLSYTYFLSLFCHCCLQLLSSKSSDRICCSFRCHIFILYSLLVGGDLLTFDAICLSMVNEVKLCWT